MTPTIDLDAVTLDVGEHDSLEDGACVMELAAYVADEPWSDHPQCVSPVIADFLRVWNDALDNETRQQLKPYAPRVIGTNTGEKDDETRALLCAQWLVRECAPAWLDLAGLDDHATALRSRRLESIEDWNTAANLASAARSAAGPAAWYATRSAAGSAAWYAARSAAESAARSAAGSAARSAAGYAAWSAAGSAASSAAWYALEPTVKLLQQSAFELLDRMITVGKR